jgi:hypothetical protein
MKAAIMLGCILVGRLLLNRALLLLYMGFRGDTSRVDVVCS